jgi:glycosyltransferase involved in cell wall biosynthesis
VRAADAVVATTRTYAQTSRALWRREDVDVVPNAVDVARFAPGPESAAVRRRHELGTRRVALFVGRLTHHKGVEEFIRAARWTGDDVAHLVVGDGPRRAALEALAARVAPARKVVFAGRVDAAELPQYYRTAAVGVLPSTSRLEAFGIAALECMASGRPVVVSDMPGVTEVIEPGATGLLAEPLDPQDLAEKIARLASDPELASAMGKAARARVEQRFTLRAVTDEVERVYARVLKAG